MSFKSHVFVFLFLVISASVPAKASAADYTGQFDPVLVPNVEDFERVIFKQVAAGRWTGIGPVGEKAHLAGARLFDPQSGQPSIAALLVEEKGKNPIIYIDVNGDNNLTSGEEFGFEAAESGNPYLWKTTVYRPIKDSFFTACPLFLQYYKDVQVNEMLPSDRLITQSTEVFARGNVDVNGKKALVQYAYKPGDKKVSPQVGWLGVDADGDGAIDMDNLSPEAAKADNESVIFKVGDMYLSTKKADVSKNQITMREHAPKEYKRLELGMGKEFPDFSFTDFEGKKRKFSDFRGKFVLLDIWGFWCPPCRKELPYIREAHKRFKGRNLEIIGLNTDETFTVDSMKKGLNESGMTWTNAKFDSVVDFLRSGLRISSFPTTFLISPEGKILSMSRQERDEPDLRGSDLLKSLDKALPKQ